MATRVTPHRASWYASAVIGRDIEGGTETNEIDGYFDSKPVRADLKTEGWKILEFTARRIPKEKK